MNEALGALALAFAVITSPVAYATVRAGDREVSGTTWPPTISPTMP